MASIVNALTSGGGVAISGDTSGVLALQTNSGTTAVTITTAQNVGIGTATPTDDGGYGKIVDIYGSTGGAVYLHTSTATNYAFLGKYNSSTQLADSGSAGLTFATASGSTPVERMRIDSSGTVFINSTTVYNNSRFNLAVGAQNGMSTSTTQNSHDAITFYTNTNTFAGRIIPTSSSCAYTSASDYRLKENITPMTGALAKVLQLKPVNFKWKTDGSDGQGFIAHELQALVPDCVSGEKDEVDTNNNPKYQGIDTSFLVATLTAAIQEQQALITAQAETINALTARIVAIEQR